MAVGLPERPTIDAFERGVSVARIAAGFGCDPKDVVDFVSAYYLREGWTPEEIAAKFAEHWGV